MTRKKPSIPFQPDLMAFPLGHGGKRIGSGRKPSGKTAVVRVSVDILNYVTQIKDAHNAGILIDVTLIKKVDGVQP